MFAKVAVTACAAFSTVSVDQARATSSIEQKTVIARLCSRVISDYTAYLAGRKTPHDVRALEREYEHCAAVIYEYENLIR
ncbi:MAG: hypothetical protein KL863_14410 [Rhizobium sp.]|nr:hypothetical protein [Rhizobium sp.]